MARTSIADIYISRGATSRLKMYIREGHKFCFYAIFNKRYLFGLSGVVCDVVPDEKSIVYSSSYECVIILRNTDDHIPKLRHISEDYMISLAHERISIYINCLSSDLINGTSKEYIRRNKIHEARENAVTAINNSQEIDSLIRSFHYALDCFDYADIEKHDYDNLILEIDIYAVEHLRHIADKDDVIALFWTEMIHGSYFSDFESWYEDMNRKPKHVYYLKMTISFMDYTEENVNAFAELQIIAPDESIAVFSARQISGIVIEKVEVM